MRVFRVINGAGVVVSEHPERPEATAACKAENKRAKAAHYPAPTPGAALCYVKPATVKP